ncbi:MAG: response regulator, partial [Acidobacteria bacterium]|nr:response regulator [Acidobacteriota bacterium]
EDNPADVILVGEALKLHGVTLPLHVLRDGAAALSFIRRSLPGKRAPALILLDLNLPKHDGFEILAALRGQDLLSRIPVIVVSSSQNPDDERAVLALGATRYFTKPADLDDFLQLGRVIRELLETPVRLRAGSAV